MVYDYFAFFQRYLNRIAVFNSEVHVIYIYIESRLCLLKDLRYSIQSAIWSQLVLLYRNANNYKCIYVRISGDKKGHAYTTLSFSRY